MNAHFRSSLLVALGFSPIAGMRQAPTALGENTNRPEAPSAKPASRGNGAARQRLQPGAVAPDFMTRDLAGQTIRLSDFKGKVLVLDFWATWCKPCLKSLSHAQEVARRYRGQGVVVLAVCTADTRTSFEKWLKINRGQYRELYFSFDPHDRGATDYEEQATKRLYGTHSIPAQFIVARDGKIVCGLIGYRPGDVRLEAALARAGLRVDPPVARKGEAQIRERETEEAKRGR